MMLVIPLLIAWFAFWFVVNVIKTTAVNALMIATIVFLIYISYGITPEQVLNFVINLPQYTLDFITGNDSATRR